MDGTIVYAQFLNDQTAWEMNVRTSFMLDGETVYCDLTHVNGLADNVRVNTFLRKGEELAIKNRPNEEPLRRYMVDWAIRRGSHKQANPTYANWTGTEYVSVLPYVQDNLDSLSAGSFRLLPTCDFRDAKTTIPEAKRTPRP